MSDERPVEKVVRDGKVAVLVSRGFGAGWSTWNTEHCPAAIFSPGLVAQVGVEGACLEALAEKLFPGCYAGGCGSLVVEWVPVGQRFRINEYDGSESLELFGEGSWEVA